jgi:hypothetical protein
LHAESAVVDIHAYGVAGFDVLADNAYAGFPGLGLSLPELAAQASFSLLPQAYGMGAFDALPVIFQRTSMLMLAHCVPITLVQLGVPELLRVAGEDPELCRLASAYAIRLLPSLYIEALSR